MGNLACLICCLLFCCSGFASQDTEFRGFWVDAFGKGFKTPTQVDQLLADTRAANCNAVLVEVRFRGDAYYDSKLEPKALDIDPKFDPLADLIKKAHDTSKGPRIQVHAWAVVFPVWSSSKRLPEQPNHPYRLHPDWLTADPNGATWNGHHYGLDPGHPEVQRHLFRVCMDLISRYEIDGLHLDHIRYESREWGYNPVALQRFSTQTGRTEKPKPADPLWMQFRRDQVTALVRKVYLSSLVTKPQLNFSVACNTRAPGLTNVAQWTKTAAYSSTLQDWRSWLEEGIVDWAIPMTYFDMDGKYVHSWHKWITFHKDHGYNRGVVVGLGNYLNTIPATLSQIEDARRQSPNGNRLAGVCFFSYANTGKDNSPRDKFIKALVKGIGDSKPVFEKPVPVPPMSWKSNPKAGALKGVVRNANSTEVDAAAVFLTGPVSRKMSTDATGFYGSADLPPGKYTVTISTGQKQCRQDCTIIVGEVTTCDAVLKTK